MNLYPGLFTLAAAALFPTLHATIPAITLGSVDSTWQFENSVSETNGGSALLPVGFIPAYASETIAGGSANVLDLAALPNTSWLEMPNSIGGNGGSGVGLTNEWTLVMDVMFPSLATDLGLLQTDATNSNDAEVHVGGGPDLAYEYYEIALTALPDFDTLTPVATGTIGNFDITPRLRNDDFAFRFRGQIMVPTDGSYTFYTTSDDGSQLRINGNLVVDNDGLHSSQTVSGSTTLTTGYHDIEVTFFERTGQEVLTVEYQGPGITRQVIPASVLSQADYGALLLGASQIAERDTIQPNQWYRLALTCAVAGPNLECKAYLDGMQTEIGGSPVTLTKTFDGDYALPATVKLFTDDDGETQNIKINSVSYWGGALTATEIAALGSPVTAGLPDIYVVNNDNTGPGSLRTSIANVRDGGIVSFDLSLSGQTILLGSGGAVDITGKALEIDALHLAAQPIIDGADSFRILNLASSSNLTMRGLYLTRGQSIGGGGAIRNEGILTIEKCVITNSTAANGGGIANESGGVLTVIESTISNHTAGAGAGISNAGTATFERTTISGNIAGSSGGMEAISATTLINCTVAQNSATSGGGGGLSALGELNLIGCTISGNDCNDPSQFEGGGGILLNFTPILTIENTIVAGNTSNVPGEDNIGGFGTINQFGNNLTSGDPELEGLGDNGGFTHTMPPLSTSPAVAGGIPTGNTPATDQRGLPRIDNTLDIGSAETAFDPGGGGGGGLYASWATANIVSPPQDDTFNGDSELDGVENGQEYAFRMDPQLNDPLLVPMARPSAPQGTGRDMTIIIPFRLTADDLIYILLETTDLQTFNEIYRYTVSTGAELKTDPNIVTGVNIGSETISVTELAANFNPVTTFWKVQILVNP